MSRFSKLLRKPSFGLPRRSVFHGHPKRLKETSTPKHRRPLATGSPVREGGNGIRLRLEFSSPQFWLKKLSSQSNPIFGGEFKNGGWESAASGAATLSDSLETASLRSTAAFLCWAARQTTGEPA